MDIAERLRKNVEVPASVMGGEMFMLRTRDIMDAIAEIERLKVAVLLYSTHTSSCRYRGGHDCDCGLDELRQRISEQEPNR